MIDKRFRKVEPKIELLAKESKEVTNDFIAKNSDTEKLLDTVSKSYKELRMVSDKVVATEKLVSYLHNNTTLINDSKVKDFNSSVYVGKMNVVNDKMTYALNTQNQTSKKVEEVNEKRIFTVDEQRSWVLKVKEIKTDLGFKDKVDELKKDLKAIEQGINPVLASIKKTDKRFDVKKINKMYGDKIKQKIEVAQTDKENTSPKFKL